MFNLSIWKFVIPWCLAMAAAIYTVDHSSHGTARHAAVVVKPRDPLPTRIPDRGDANPFQYVVPETPMPTGALFEGLHSGWDEVFRHMSSRGLVQPQDPWRIIGNMGGGASAAPLWEIVPAEGDPAADAAATAGSTFLH